MTSKYCDRESLEARPQLIQEHATIVAMHAELAQEAQTAALRELTGRMAHHMRSPLAAIQATCRSLQTELVDPDHQQRLELTLGAVDRMLRIVSTQIGNHACVRHPQRPANVDVGQHATEIVSMFSLAYPRAGRISLVAGKSLRCRMAPLDLRIALFSLLSFAVKETAGTPIQLVIERGLLKMRPFLDDKPLMQFARGTHAARIF